MAEFIRSYERNAAICSTLLAMDSFIPSALRRHRQQRRLTLEMASGLAGLSSQHLSELGRFTRDWREEEDLDRLLDELQAGQISDKQALLRARKLLARSPGNLEIQNFVANRMWALGMRDEATEVWQQAWRQALALVPKAFGGLIPWDELDNRSFLRIAHGYLLGLMHRGDGQAADGLATQLLAWCPWDNLGVRMLMGDIALMRGDTESALKIFLAGARSSPAQWYQAGQIALRQGDHVAACTNLRRGIATNPYVAEGLTGRTRLDPHLYWHGSSCNGPEWAVDYLEGPACRWTPEERDFVDWVFNSAAVLRERAGWMALHEALTHESDPGKRAHLAGRIASFADDITGEQSERMVRKVRNRWGIETWPWLRPAAG